MDFLIEQFELDEIVGIEEVGIEETVDITLEHTNMFFLANGVYTHNSGAQADLITMENIAEAYSKCFVADLIYSISRTALDKQNKSARMFIAKNRNGADGLVLPMFFDTATAQMEVHPPLEGSNLEEEKKVVAKEQLAHITKLYKKHRKNGGAAKETSGASIIKIGETSGDSR